VQPTRAAIPEDFAHDEPVWFAEHHGAGGFFNPWNPAPLKGPRDLIAWQLGRNPFRAAKREARPPEVLPAALDRLQDFPEEARVMWLGHASALIQLDGVNLYLDPVLGRVNGLMPRLSPAPARPDALPPADAILITHGHYDHLDTASVRALVAASDRDPVVITPKGLSGALPRSTRRRVELDWWEGVDIRGVSANFVPAQHWHRRGLNDANRALWGGYVIRGSRSIYHSGDTGWFDGFRAIGRVFDGLDLAILPLGAYEPRWFMGDQHMPPEASVTAFADLGARRFLAMHWGTFDLTDEPCDHGARVLLPEILAERGLDPEPFVIARPGGSLALAEDGVHGRL
jgi:L-ascorbate metabolism protein UlaG (beta-lactamase superfamily)